MTDRREQIAARLVEIAEGIVGRVGRNAKEMTGRTSPAIVVWDGDEGAEADGSAGRRPVNAPVMVDMMPELRILHEQPADDIGTALNALRIEVIKAVIADAVSGGLRSIIGSNGWVRYEGLSTEMAPGRQMEGSMGVRFIVHYPLIPAEL